MKEAIKNEIEIIPIPGPCAFVTGLVAAGVDTKEFSFFGFLPINKKIRRKKLEEIQKESKTVILYEAPHKLLTTLNDLKKHIGKRNIVLAKELTKIHETYIRGKIDDILQMDINPKGEYVILIDRNPDIEIKEASDDISLEEEYIFYENQGYEKKDIIKKIAQNRNVKKNEIYQHFLNK